MSASAVELVWLDARLAAEIVADGSREGWAPDFPEPINIEVARGWLLRAERGLAPEPPFGDYLIRARAESLVVGGIGCHGSPVNGLVEIGYDVVPSRRRRGYAKAAITRLVEILSAHPAVLGIVAQVNPANEASQRALLAAGFRYDPAASGATLVFSLPVD